MFGKEFQHAAANIKLMSSVAQPDDLLYVCLRDDPISVDGDLIYPADVASERSEVLFNLDGSITVVFHNIRVDTIDEQSFEYEVFYLLVDDGEVSYLRHQ